MKAPELAEGSVELYASLGRRHGAKPGDYEALLRAHGVPDAAVSYVRVRQRNTFIAVDEGELERTLAALEGQSIGGHTLRVEPSRGGQPRAEETAAPVLDDL